MWFQPNVDKLEKIVDDAKKVIKEAKNKLKESLASAGATPNSRTGEII